MRCIFCGERSKVADGRLSPDVPGVLAANEGAGRPGRRRRGLPQDEAWDGQLCRADKHRGSKPGFSSAASTHGSLSPCTLVTLPVSGGGGDSLTHALMGRVRIKSLMTPAGHVCPQKSPGTAAFWAPEAASLLC